MKFLKLLLLITTINLTAQTSRFKDNETLNVWAASGLNMRDKPEAKATKIATIPYGAKVSVQPNIGLKIPFEVEEFKGFIVKGYWLLVKYGNTEGFVFDGFLSRLPAPSLTDNGRLEEYLNIKIGKIGKKYDIQIFDKIIDKYRFSTANDRFDEKDITGFTQKYKYDIIYEHGKGEGGGDSRIESPNLTFYESYFLVKTFFFPHKPEILEFNKKDKNITFAGEECEFTIKKIGDKIVIDGYCGC